MLNRNNTSEKINPNFNPSNHPFLELFLPINIPPIKYDKIIIIILNIDVDPFPNKSK